MEHTLGAYPLWVGRKIAFQGLNPCSNGTYSRSGKMQVGDFINKS